LRLREIVQRAKYPVESIPLLLADLNRRAIAAQHQSADALEPLI